MSGVFKKGISIAICAALLLGGCTSPSMPETTAPAELSKTEAALQSISQLGQGTDDAYRTWYEIFVYSFCDSDGDGIGDLKGVTQKIPYLKSLGITGIWLMPIHPSTTYHKYNVSDYYSIDADYGTLEDFDALVAACDDAGIRIILDLVVNHTGSEHPWFQDAVSYLQNLSAEETPNAEDCAYLDYYHFGSQQQIKGNSSAVSGTDYYYESQFSYDMPDLNLDNPSVREEIRSIMQFWIDRGVDGFRLDAAKEFYSGNTTKNVEFLSWLQTTATEIHPDCYLVAEVWDTFATITAYYESGINSIFDYPFGNSDGKIVSVLRGAGQPSVVSTYATALEKADKAYAGKNSDYMDAPFLSNHDVGRIAGFVSRDEQKTKMAGAMNLFMSGNAFIYYGEEIGMIGAGNDPSKRAPMVWNAEGTAGTTNPPPDCTIPESYPFGSLEEQLEADDSVYNYYRQAIAIRNALPVISHGRTTAETQLNSGCVSAVRKTWEEQSCLILYNISTETAEVDLSAYSQWELVASLASAAEEILANGTTLHIPSFGIAVLLPST